MTNEEKYKTLKDRSNAFFEFCKSHNSCSECSARKFMDINCDDECDDICCSFAWLKLDENADKKIKVPDEIRSLMHKIAKDSLELKMNIDDLEHWFIKNLEIKNDNELWDILFSENGLNINSLEDGIDITDEICKKIESGEHKN